MMPPSSFLCAQKCSQKPIPKVVQKIGYEAAVWISLPQKCVF